ncbi:hypothetical protein N7462_005007 [Penicillium macrosclerotiorum]|uniref:uncharacterized protein n=1 Tax=Penicillium macrosclerotiorum TaxID=303699 RepID=UPI002546C1D4|nr:uncharacterized protein N7462_005007 [Penicillium macrosclerotiorum]KAJ5690615.1 hypothetical protein N7462_005007 [Penicillium macrosclerotiorum]
MKVIYISEKIIQTQHLKAGRTPSRSQTGVPAESSWESAKNQLARFMVRTHNKQGSLLLPMFGVVGIGKLARFYKLADDNDNNNDILKPYQDDDGKNYDLSTEFSLIEKKLLDMKHSIEHG